MNRRFCSLGYWSLAALTTAALAVAPLAGMPAWALTVLGQTFALALFAMSFDLLFGYAGVVSFGHAAFFGIGGYSLAIASRAVEGGSTALVSGAVAGIALSATLGALEGLILGRVKEGYFAMVTLAISQILLLMTSSQNLRPLTGGSDGLNVVLPTAFVAGPGPYYLLLGASVLGYWLLRHLVESPVGLVWRGIRENEQRMESMGYNVLAFKIAVNVVAAVFAAVAGMLYIVVMQIATPDLFGLSNSLNVLLMVIIGGAGTLLGPLIGAALLTWAQYELSSLGSTLPVLSHWLILFGLLFIAIVMLAPRGILGALEAARMRFKTHETPGTDAPSGRRDAVRGRLG